MRIDKLELTNFKNFSSLQVEFCSGVNLFAGVNGSGKSAILEAVNVALGCFFASREHKMQRLIRLSEVTIQKKGSYSVRSEYCSVKAYSQIPEGNWERNFNSITSSNDVKGTKLAANYGEKVFERLSLLEDRSISPLLAYYSTQRLFKESSQSKKQTFDPLVGKRNGYLQCLSDNSIKNVLIEWFSKAIVNRATTSSLSIDKRDLVLDNVEFTLKKALAYFVEEVNIEEVKIFPDANFEYELFVHIDNDNQLPLNYFSDGLRNILYLTMDMVWRASTLNPWLSFEELRENQYGCVTIDEIDLHLHPKWQSKAVEFIKELFPNVQFFITTHSPVVISNFKARNSGKLCDQLYLINNDNISPVNASFGADVNGVLETIMDTKSRPEKISNLIDLFYDSMKDELMAKEEAENALAIVQELGGILPSSDKELIKILGYSEILKRFLKNS